MSRTPEYYDLADIGSTPLPSMKYEPKPPDVYQELRRLYVNAFDIGLIGGVLGFLYGRSTGFVLFTVFALGGALWAYFFEKEAPRRRKRIRIAGCLLVMVEIAWWSPAVQEGLQTLLTILVNNGLWTR